jgi:hypothetical protein
VARAELASDPGNADDPERRGLEEAALRARLALGAERPRGLVRELSEAARQLSPDLTRARPFVALALTFLLAAFLVGYLAVDADSRLGDLVLASTRRHVGVEALGDPVGGLMVGLLGPRDARHLAGAGTRLLILQGLFLGGLAMGLVPLAGLAAVGLRWGVLLSRPFVTPHAGLMALAGAGPALLAVIFASAGGLGVAHALLAPGRQTRGASLARGLREGAILWGLAVASHAMMTIPSPGVRGLAALGILACVLMGRVR